MFMKTLKSLQKNLILAIPAAMVLGLVLGNLFDLGTLKVTILPLTILMIYPMMVTLNVRSVFNGCEVPLQATTQLMNFVVIPALAFGLGRTLLADQPLSAFGLLLIALLPTSGMTISWTGFAKGNVTAAIKMTVIGLVSGALLTPVYAHVLMGQVVEVPLWKTFQQIGLVIFVPMILGFLTQTWLVRRYGRPRFNTEIKPHFPAVSTLGVLGIIVIAMGLKAKTIVAQPELILRLLVPLIAFYLLAYALTTLVGRLFFARADAVALVYGSVMRNLSVALAIALTVFQGEQGAEIALIIAAAFIVQVQSAAWYVRLADRLLPGRSRAESVS